MILVRPEDITLHPEEDRSPDAFILKGKIIDVMMLGHYLKVIIDTGENREVYAFVNREEIGCREPGEEITYSWRKRITTVSSDIS